MKSSNKKPYFSPRSDVGYSEAGVLAFDVLSANHSGAAASDFHRLALRLSPHSRSGTPLTYSIIMKYTGTRDGNASLFQPSQRTQLTVIAG